MLRLRWLEDRRNAAVDIENYKSRETLRQVYVLLSTPRRLGRWAQVEFEGAKKLGRIRWSNLIRNVPDRLYLYVWHQPDGCGVQDDVG